MYDAGGWGLHQSPFFLFYYLLGFHAARHTQSAAVSGVATNL
jgi:hypothetical protein